MAYWLALAEDDRADIVDVPFVTAEGATARSRIALSGGSAIAVVDAPDWVRPRDLDDAEALSSVRARIAAVHAPARGTDVDTKPDPVFWDEI